MTRPAIEVADIVRAKGSQFLECYQSGVSYHQLKAFRAVERCRTAALGGHKDKCVGCQYEAPSPLTPALWGVLTYGEFNSEQARSWRATRPFDAPLRPGFQKSDEFIGRSEFPLAKMRGNDSLNRFQLLTWIGPHVHVGGGETAMAQPQRKLPDVLCCRQDDHGGGKSENVR